LTIGYNFKCQIKRALISSRLIQTAARVMPEQIAILKYHSVQDDPRRYLNSLGGGIVMSTSTFRNQMEIVARKFNPVTMDDVLLFFSGKKHLPRKPVVITFDDGFADNIEIAVPIMHHFGIRAAFYITVDPVEQATVPWFCRIRHAFAVTRRQTWLDSINGCTRDIAHASDRRAAFLVASERCARCRGAAQKNSVATIEEELEVQPLAEKLMMTWTQVRILRQLGHIVGSHTVTHPNMAYMDAADLQIECVESKNKLEKELGAEVCHFSYPSPILQPHWSKQTVECTERAGYKCAVTSTAGPARRGQHPLSIQRVVVSDDADQFLWILENTMLGRRFP